MLDKSKPTLAVLVAVFMLSSVFIGTSWNNTNITAMNLNRGNHIISSASSIVIDGNLSVDEWSDAVHKVQWYMDADASNSDGYNYMYLDEDPYNLYIALDLCSDQTNDSTGEWVGLWLNTNETDIYNPEWATPIEWAEALDKGIESLLHDVDTDLTIEYFTDLGPSVATTLYPEEWIAVKGTADGNPDDIWYDDNTYVKMTSEYNGTHYVYRLDVDTDFYDLFPVFQELYNEHVLKVDFILLSQHNDTIDEHFLSVSDDQGNLNPDIKIPLGIGTSEYYNLTEIFRENFTSSSNVRLSMNGANSAPFNTSIDFLRVPVYTNERTHIAQNSVLPYASIRNYDIAWAFGPTENNASDHRSFEIKIPKSELEGYEMDTDLGIIAGGYGTLASWPGTHRWVLAGSIDTGIPEEDSSEYLNYTMPMKGWTPPGTPVLNAITPNPDTDGNVLVNWNDAATAENWTVYRYSSQITEATLESATEIASGLTESQYNDTELSEGTYWDAVEALDEFGYSYLSNSVSVTVEFLPIPPPSDPTLLLIVGGVGAVVLVAIVIIVMKKR
ncbi:MAG: hypothetical protein ACXAB5_04285 [Candidatus Thorarchaeota archaeon]|jgi:hypothetical protein